MKKWLGRLGWALAFALVGVGMVALIARFLDGPVGPIAGGPLVSGHIVTEPVRDWSFARDIETVEFQLVDPPRSRTVWTVVHEGAIYVPCGVPQFRLWKQWPHEAMRDGRAVLRVEGLLHPLRAVRVTNPAMHAVLGGLVQEKYDLPGDDPPGPDSVWFFRMDPR